MASLEEINTEIDRRTQLEAVTQEITRRGLGVTSGAPEAMPPTGGFDPDKFRVTPFGVSPFGKEFDELGAEVGDITREHIATEAGVLFEEGAPAGVRAKASFGVDERESLKAFQTNLTTFFREQGELGPGETVELRTGPETQELEFLHPKFKQFSLVNPIGADFGDITALSGDAIAVIPDIAATLAISIFTLNPIFGIPTQAAGRVTAGPVGAFAGEYARIKIGQSMGINEDLTESQIVAEAQKAAGWSFAGGVTGELGARIIKAVNNLLRGRAVLKDAGPLSPRDVDEAAMTAREVNERIGDGKLRFTSGQAGDDPDLLALQETFRKDPDVRAFTAQQNAALTDFWRNINEPFTPALTTGPTATGRQVARAVGGRVRAAQAGAEARVAGAEAEALAAREALPVTARETAGEPIRAAFEAEQKAFNDWAGDRAAELDAIAGNVPLIENKFTKAATAKLEKEVEETLIPALQKQKRALIAAFRDEEGALSGVLATDFSFSSYWNTVSELGRRIRVAKKGLTTETQAVGDLKLLRKAIERDAEESLKGTAIAEPFDTFRATMVKEKDRLDRSMVGRIVETAETQFKVPPETVFDTIFKSSTEADAVIVADILQKNPQAEQLFREGIFDFYQLAVVKDGKFNKAAHDLFFKRHGRRLEHFFPESVEELQKVGQLEKVVENLSKRREVTMKALDKTFQGEIASTNPKAIFRTVWPATGPDPTRIADLKRALKQDPKVLDAFKAEVQRDMGERITSLQNQTRQLSAINLDKYLHGTGVEGAGGRAEGLKELFGEQYVKDLTVLLRALKTAQRNTIAPSAPSPTEGNALIDLLRIWTGVISKKALTLTAARRISRRSSNRVLISAILDPEKMEKLRKLTTLSTGSKNAAAILGQLGGLELGRQIDK